MKNRVTEVLGIEYPIIGASMAWLTSAEMAGAISKAGGLGMLGPNAGQSVATADVAETGERLREQIRRVREITNKPFAVNFIVPNPHFPPEISGEKYSRETIRICEEEGVKVILASGDFVEGEIKALKDKGFTVMYRCYNCVLADSLKAQEEGADILIATGYDGGGHLNSHHRSTVSIVAEMADNLDIPVVAAGGIVDRRFVKACTTMGAEGVYCGTVFLPTYESPAADICKKMIIESRFEDLVEFDAIHGTIRSVPTPAAEKCIEMMKEGKDRMDIARVYSSGFQTGMRQGNMDIGICSVNSEIGSMNEIKHIADIMEELKSGF